MPGTDAIVIVGAGLAGARAAQTLREEGHTGRITLIGAEPRRPYDRPPLSKGYLTGNQPESEIYLHDDDWYEANGVELLLGLPVTDLLRADHKVELADGAHIPYDKVLLATGATPRRLDVPGAELAGIRYLRTFSDSSDLRVALREGGRTVIVGGGWIGLEVASAARGYGGAVTVIEPQATPLNAVLGDRIGGYFADVHSDRGVDMRVRTGVTEFTGVDGRVTGVVTSDGTRIEADVVVVGVGVVPESGLAANAGLTVDNGVVVDEFYRTGDPDVYAVGDVASVYKPFYGRHVRVEHWANALDGGPAAARAMLGLEPAADQVPFFYSDQYDLGLEYAGWYPPHGYDAVVTRGDVPGNAFYAFWLNGSELVAGMHVNQWDDGIAPVQRIIRTRTSVDPARLSDVDVPWSELAP